MIIDESKLNLIKGLIEEKIKNKIKDNKNIILDDLSLDNTIIINAPRAIA